MTMTKMVITGAEVILTHVYANEESMQKANTNPEIFVYSLYV